MHGASLLRGFFVGGGVEALMGGGTVGLRDGGICACQFIRSQSWDLFDASRQSASYAYLQSLHLS